MAQKSVFREFMAALKKHWKEEVPFIRPVSETLGQLPKASTFYAGATSRSGQHVYLYFQHSSKAWQVGQFTINVVLATDANNPQMAMGNRSGQDFGDGYYRIGYLVGKKDKWWHLKADDDPILTQVWRPSSYDNLAVVLSGAVDDVTRDVQWAMQLLGVTSGREHKAEPGASPNGGPAERLGDARAGGGPPSVS
jgi:hypothetical protein